MKKLVSILSILTIAFSLSLTACGGAEQGTPETTPTESESVETEEGEEMEEGEAMEEGGEENSN